MPASTPPRYPQYPPSQYPPGSGPSGPAWPQPGGPDYRGRALLIFFGIVIFGGLFIAGLVVYPRFHPAAGDNISAVEQHRETRDAFDSTVGPTDQESHAISAALDQFNAAIRSRDPVAIGAIFDGARLYNEVSGRSIGSMLNPMGSADAAAFGRGFATGMVKQASIYEWSSHQVKKIIFSSDHTQATVYDLEFHDKPHRFFLKMRWWMENDGGQWKLWDMEALSQGMRVSTVVAASLSSRGLTTTVAPGILPVIQQLNIVTAGIQKDDLPGCETALKTLDGMSMPSKFAATRDLYWAVLHTKQGRYQDVLNDCDRALGTGEDVPLAYQCRTVAYNKLGRYEEALQSDAKWEDELGGDIEVYYQKGMALEHLKRKDEAAAAYGKSLDEDPDAMGSMTALSGVLPAGKKEELARRFGLCQDPKTVFAGVLAGLLLRRDLDGMESLIEAYRARSESADDPMLTYYDGELKIFRKKYKEAEAELQTLLADSLAKDYQRFVTEYVYAAYLAGDSINGYLNAPDQPAAFKSLAGRLLFRDKKTLQQLVTMHLQRYARDPWGHYYEAKLLEAAGQYDLADDAYAAAMSDADEKSVVTMRYARVSARFKSGKGLSAYGDITPKDKVFTQLALQFANGKQLENLTKLNALREADAPDDPNLPLWKAQAAFMSKDYSGAVEILTVNHSQIESNKLNKYRASDLYIRSEVRLKNFDGAREEIRQAEGQYKDWWHIAVVETAAGNVGAATEALNNVLQDEDTSIDEVYGDPDIGPALESPGFADWRAAHPKPTTRATTLPDLD